MLIRLGGPGPGAQITKPHISTLIFTNHRRMQGVLRGCGLGTMAETLEGKIRTDKALETQITNISGNSERNPREPHANKIDLRWLLSFRKVRFRNPRVHILSGESDDSINDPRFCKDANEAVPPGKYTASNQPLENLEWEANASRLWQEAYESASTLCKRHGSPPPQDSWKSPTTSSPT